MSGVSRILQIVLSLSATSAWALLSHTRPQPPITWDAALAAFADEIRATTRGMKDPTVVLSLAAGTGLRPRFLEMLVHYERRAKLPLAVVALDNGTHGFFRSHGVVSMFFDVDGFGLRRHGQPKGWQLREAVMRGKFEVTEQLLARGLTVVMSELDVYWKTNPMVLLEELPGDFLVSEHQHDRGGEINVGFYIAKPTEKVLRTFTAVKTWLNSELRGDAKCGGCFDQMLLDYALKCTPEAKLIAKCSFPEAEQALLCNGTGAERPAWGRIPWERLPHPPLHHHYSGGGPGPEQPKDSKMQEYMAVLRATAVGTHLWSGFARSDEQMHFAFLNGLWTRGVPAPPAPRPWHHSYGHAFGGPERMRSEVFDLHEAPCGCDDFGEDTSA